jgi:hypothetical protein
MALGLTAKILALHAALESAELPHAFGGALALAFCTSEPRGTKDIDLNVFSSVEELDVVLRALPREVAVRPDARLQLERDAQARLWWDQTPVDLFLSNHPFHAHVGANRRQVPFAGVDLPVLACDDLAVFKVFFGRPKDAVDIASMVDAGAIELAEVAASVRAYLGDERDAFLERVEQNLGGTTS